MFSLYLDFITRNIYLILSTFISETFAYFLWSYFSTGVFCMKSLKIVHCAYFKTIYIRGCFWAGMAYKLNNGLTRLGHNVVSFNDRDVNRAMSWFGAKTPFSIRKTNECFLKYCLDIVPDAIILGHADIISADTLLKIREKIPHIKIIQWNVDCINPYAEMGNHNIRNITSKLDAVDFTLITTADKKLYERFEPQKHIIGFIPNPVDKSIENVRAFENPHPDYDLLFAASPVKLREFADKMCYGKEIADFLKRKAPQNKFLFPKIYDPALNGVNYFDTFAKSAAVLNLSVINHDYLYSSDRMAHAMGCGCLTYISRHTGFNDLLGEDEAGFFSTTDELLEKIEFYRNSPKERTLVAQRGWKHYHELFNELIVGKYIADLITDNFNSQDFPFPTIG